MKQLTYLIINTATLLGALFVNYLSGTGFINGQSVGDVSARYKNLFTPAGYAFGIWGLIYMLLISFVVYQWFSWFRTGNDYELNRTGLWFALTNIINASWIFAWNHEQIGLSLILSIALLLILIILIFRLRLETWDAPVRIIAFVWWPICVYTGWILIATVANASAYFVSIGWTGHPLSESRWTIIIILIAAILYLLLVYYRNMREAGIVGVWGLLAIAVKQWNANPEIAYTALAAAVVVFSYLSYHAYKNRATSPFSKMQRGEI